MTEAEGEKDDLPDWPKRGSPTKYERGYLDVLSLATPEPWDLQCHTVQEPTLNFARFALSCPRVQESWRVERFGQATGQGQQALLRMSCHVYHRYIYA